MTSSTTNRRWATYVASNTFFGTVLGFAAGYFLPLWVTNGSAAPLSAICTTPLGFAAGLVFGLYRANKNWPPN